MANDSNSSSGKTCFYTILGIVIMVGGFFGGFSLFFQQDVFDLGISQILFYVLVIPMISALVGIGVILYGNRHNIRRATRINRAIWSGTPINIQTPTFSQQKERTFVHQPPRFCPDCGAVMNAEEIDWVGPLTVKCSYCGATVATEKREV
jgi:hypothetical protein